jgi:hypothetical protein
MLDNFNWVSVDSNITNVLSMIWIVYWYKISAGIPIDNRHNPHQQLSDIPPTRNPVDVKKSRWILPSTSIGHHSCGLLLRLYCLVRVIMAQQLVVYEKLGMVSIRLIRLQATDVECDRSS